MSTDREAKVRLDVEKTGDPDAFRDLAEDVAAAEGAADSTTEAAERLAAGIDSASEAASRAEIAAGLEAAKTAAEEARDAALSYAESLATAAEAGEAVGGAQIRQLEELQGAWVAAVEEVRSLEAAQRSAAEEIGATTSRAQEQAQALGSAGAAARELGQAVREVDPAPLREAGASAAKLPDPLEAARAATEGLAEHFADLSPEAWRDLEDAIANTNAQLEELAQAEGPDEQRKAAEALSESYRRLREVVGESFDSSTAASQRFLASIDDLERVSSRIAEPFSASLGEAERAMSQLEESITRGFRGSEQRAAMARLAVEQYRRELQEARATGVEATEAQIQALRELEARYEAATRQVGEFRRQQQETKRDLEASTTAAGGLTGGLTSMHSIMALLGPKAVRFNLILLAAYATFRAFYTGTTKAREALQGFGVDLDGFIQGTPAFQQLQSLIDFFSGVRNEAELTRGELIRLQQLGLDPAGKSAAEMRAEIEATERALAAQRGEVGKASAEYRAWRTELDATGAGLDAGAEKFREHVEALRDGAEELSEFEFAKLIEPELNKWIGHFERARREAPEWMRQMRAELLEVLAGVASDLEAEGKEIPAWLANLKKEFEETTDAISKGFDKAGKDTTESVEAIKAALEEWRESGRPIPDDLAEQAEGVGLVVEAWEKHNEIISFTPRMFKEMGEAAEEAIETTEELPDFMLGFAEGAEDAAVAVDTFAESERGAAGAAEEMEGGVGDAAKKVEELKGETTGVGKSIKDDFQEVEGFDAPMLEGLDRIKARTEEAREALRELKREAQEV